MPGIYRGDINIGTTIRFAFNTRDSSGNPSSLSGSPVVSIYKGGIATPCATAPVLTVNYNGQTGRHLVTVDTSLDTTFYAAGNDFFAVITTGNVNGVSVVGVEVAQWSINNRSVVTAVQIRQEMDSNSTKLGNLDAAVSSRLATSTYTTPPTVSAIQSGLATHSDTTAISAAISALGSPLQATAYAAPTTPPTVVQIRQEMDSNSTKLANLDAAVSSRLATSTYTTPPTVSAIQSGLATHSDTTAISAAITALGSPLQATAYAAPTTPPTVVQIRQEMDSNSTRLANLDVAVSSRLATSAYTTPPTASAIQSGLATHSDTTAISAAISALGSPLQATAYTAPTTPPTVVQIRQEMDSNSTRLANLDVAVSSRLATSTYTTPPTVSAIQSGLATHADATTISAAISALGSPLQSGNYVLPPSAAVIAATTAAVLFVDGATNPIKVNSDHSVNSTTTSTSPISIVIPAVVAVASQDPSVMTCLRGDTLRFTLPLMGDLRKRTKLVFTAKASVSDSDSMAVLQIFEGTGLVRLNGNGQVISSTASLIVTNESTGAVNLEIDARVTAVLAVQDLVWDVQAILSTGVTTPVCGTLTVVADVTQSVT